LESKPNDEEVDEVNVGNRRSFTSAT
jgi:hypothetical protein